MNKKTLRQFIQNCQISSYKEEQTDFSSMSWRQKCQEYHSRRVYSAKFFSKKEDSLCYGTRDYSLKRVGDKFFTSSKISEYIYITPKGIKIYSGSKPGLVFEFLKFINPNILKNLGLDSPSRRGCSLSYWPLMHLANVNILRSVLCGTIYSQETFYRAIMKRVYKCNMNWKVFKDYLHLQVYNKPSVCDLMAFTKNAENSMIAFCRASDDYRCLMCDTLDYAVDLNQIIDFNWSYNRMHIEHQKQVDRMHIIDLEEKDKTPIYNNIIPMPENIKLLNTEVDIYKEGTNMHHCIYNCYYRRIRDHKYMAFHMTAPEDCTIGVSYYGHQAGDAILIDQIYKKYDEPVNEETRRAADRFVTKYSDLIVSMFNQEINN